MQKSIARLRAILALHADWRAAGKSGGVIYVCADQKGCARIRKRAAEAGLRPGKGGLRVEPLETIKLAAVVAPLATAAQRLPAAPIAQLRRPQRVALVSPPRSKSGWPAAEIGE